MIIDRVGEGGAAEEGRGGKGGREERGASAEPVPSKRAFKGSSNLHFVPCERDLSSALYLSLSTPYWIVFW